MDKTYTLAHKMTFVSFGVALVSLFFKWVNAGFLGSANGFQGWTVILPLILLYPVVLAYRKETITKGVGLGFVAGGFLLGIIVIMRNSVNIFGETANLSGSGPYVYLVSIVLFAIAVYMQPKEEVEEIETKEQKEEVEKES